MRSRDVIKRIEADGWYEVRQTGSHKQFRHPAKPGTVTVPHPKKEMPVGTLKSISKQSGVPLP
jgi:predicted RNA binding protein YcfA (HicA-like mRNA interferase family)